MALSQTGNLADSAAPYFKGLDLWREQANARGGLAGRPIEFVIYDDRSDPATAARLYETSDHQRQGRFRDLLARFGDRRHRLGGRGEAQDAS